MRGRVRPTCVVLAQPGMYTAGGRGSTIRRVIEDTPAEDGAQGEEPGALAADPGPVARRDQLAAVFHAARECTRCPQLASARTQVVFGGGDADAQLMLVGDAPGPREDVAGVPFAGAVGRVLDELLASIELDRASVFLTTVLKCRTPDNRDPSPTEIGRCQDYLAQQVGLVRPRVIAALGSTALRELGGTGPLADRRGQAERVEIGGHEAWLVALSHPAAALYTRGLLDTARADFALLGELLARTGPQTGAAAPVQAHSS